MGDLVSLNRAKKRLAKNQSVKQAEMNRAKFGRTKTERKSEAAKAANAAKTLDQHKLPGDAT
jgi:hypothetical protein